MRVDGYFKISKDLPKFKIELTGEILKPIIIYITINNTIKYDYHFNLFYYLYYTGFDI